MCSFVVNTHFFEDQESFPFQTDDDFLFPIPDWFRSVFLETGILACVLVSDIINITTFMFITITIITDITIIFAKYMILISSSSW